jgi:small redox-active disulfide protein 2
MKIEVLGGGCANCKKLYESVQKAVLAEGINAEIIKEENYDKIIEYGITSTPAVAVNGKVVSTGRVLKSEEVVSLLQAAQ